MHLRQTLSLVLPSVFTQCDFHLFHQRRRRRRCVQHFLELRQLVKDSQVGVLLHVVEVTPAGGDRFAEAGEGQVDVLLPVGLLVGGQRFAFGA